MVRCVPFPRLKSAIKIWVGQQGSGCRKDSCWQISDGPSYKQPQSSDGWSFAGMSLKMALDMSRMLPLGKGPSSYAPNFHPVFLDVKFPR